MNVAAVIVAGGSSLRCDGSVPKQFRDIDGKPLLAWTVGQFEMAHSIDNIVIVVADEYLLYTNEQVVNPFDFRKVSKIVSGGEKRCESVLKGLEALPISTGIVAIHDGARPMTRPDDIDRTVELATRERAAILAVRATDTVKRVADQYILSTLERDTLYLAQTPQVFQYDLILQAHRELAEKAPSEQEAVTDDASLIEAKGFKVTVVEPTGPNLKVTSPDDLELVRALLGNRRD